MRLKRLQSAEETEEDTRAMDVTPRREPGRGETDVDPIQVQLFLDSGAGLAEGEEVPLGPHLPTHHGSQGACNQDQGGTGRVEDVRQGVVGHPGQGEDPAHRGADGRREDV